MLNERMSNLPQKTWDLVSRPIFNHQSVWQWDDNLRMVDTLPKNLYEGFPMYEGSPKSSSIPMGFSPTKTIQLWRYPHDYGNPHMKVHMFFSFCWPGLPTLRWQFLPPQGQLATTSTLDLPQSSTQPLCHWSKTAKTDSDWSSENVKCSFVIHFEIQQDVISSFWISLTQSHAAFLHFAAVPA